MIIGKNELTKVRRTNKMTPQKCELCNGEFKSNIKKFDSSLLGYSFVLCKYCLNSIVKEKLQQ